MSNEKLDTRISYYLENKQLREEGKFIGIPLYQVFPRFGEFIPTIPKGVNILFTAASGIGKSHTWLGLILLPTYYLAKSLNLKIKFVIFLLEDDYDFLIDRLFCAIFWLKHRIRIDTLELRSLRRNALNSNYVEKFEAIKEEVEDILSHCEVIDNIFNATGIYKTARTISELDGKHVKKDKEFIDSDDNGIRNSRIERVYSHYEPNDPELHTICIIDNLNNLGEEKSSNGTLSQRECINLMTRKYARLQMTKHWKWTVIQILQQASDGEKQEFYKGETIIDKLEPALSDLGNSKECQRDFHLIFGLFAPYRYNIHDYFGYDIDKCKDNFRALKILKSNISGANIRVPLYFDGANSYFKELPVVNQMTDNIYQQIQNFNYGRV